MSNTMITAADLETLRTFAGGWGLLPFSHLVTAAINGEEWAMARLNQPSVLAIVEQMRAAEAAQTLLTDEQCASMVEMLDVLDTSRPDGAIARKLEWI